jgi:hypothetical protein
MHHAARHALITFKNRCFLHIRICGFWCWSIEKRNLKEKSFQPKNRGVMTNCWQTVYALRVLRTHGMCDLALQTILWSVVVAKLLYAYSAWWGFSNATDRQRVNAFLGRNIRCGYRPTDLPPFEELCRQQTNSFSPRS